MDKDIDEIIFSKVSKRIHLIGVAGSGMSGLAQIFLKLGHKVSGSDKVTTIETDNLQNLGLSFFCPHVAESVIDAELVVYSSAIREGNAALKKAKDLGIKLCRRADALACLVQKKKGIVVAGTHGKTTTSAMLSHIFNSTGFSSSYYIGAEVPILGKNANWDKDSDYFVAEGDESDGTLSLYSSNKAILLNIEADHLDFFSDGIDSIKKLFIKFLRQVDDLIVYYKDDEISDMICNSDEVKNSKNNPKIISYGLDSSADYYIKEYKQSGQSSIFQLFHNSNLLGNLTLNIPGKHNVINAVGATAMAMESGIDFASIGESIGSFRSAKRRFEQIYKGKRFRVVDDYGHHPTEIATTIDAAKSLKPNRVLCLFQPHRYSRTKLLKKEFGESFDNADILCVTDIYPASESPIKGIDGMTIIDSVKEKRINDNVPINKSDFVYSKNKDTAHLEIGNMMRRGDLALIMGAGNIHNAGKKLAKHLNSLEMILDKIQVDQTDKEIIYKLYEPMRLHTTVKIGGPAQYWFVLSKIKTLIKLIKCCREFALPYHVVGRGSNLLVRDGGISGVVINLKGGDFDKISINKDNSINVGCGISCRKLATFAKDNNIGGFSWMEGIPGNIGGCLRMNAGAMGVELADILKEVSVVDEFGELKEIGKDDLKIEYRNIPFFDKCIGVSATMKGVKEDSKNIADVMRNYMKKRKESQPQKPNSGCIFKNPKDENKSVIFSAGQVIDELGLKGLTIGEAQISEVHGNFIINKGKATAKDIIDIITKVKSDVLKKKGVELECEIKIIGEQELIW